MLLERARLAAEATRNLFVHVTSYTTHKHLALPLPLPQTVSSHVSHLLQCDDNPGVNALHVEGRGWVLSGDEKNAIEYRGLYANIRCWPGIACNDSDAPFNALGISSLYGTCTLKMYALQ